jgi:hypothetical protein
MLHPENDNILAYCCTGPLEYMGRGYYQSEMFSPRNTPRTKSLSLSSAWAVSYKAVGYRSDQNRIIVQWMLYFSCAFPQFFLQSTSPPVDQGLTCELYLFLPDSWQSLRLRLKAADSVPGGQGWQEVTPGWWMAGRGFGGRKESQLSASVFRGLPRAAEGLGGRAGVFMERTSSNWTVSKSHLEKSSVSA